MRDCILRLSMYWLRVWGSGAQRLWTSPHPELVPLRALPPKLTWLDRQRLLIVELLRLGVQGAALLDYLEAGQLQSLACLLASLDPRRLLAWADFFLLTTLPCLFLVRSF